MKKITIVLFILLLLLIFYFFIDTDNNKILNNSTVIRTGKEFEINISNTSGLDIRNFVEEFKNDVNTYKLDGLKKYINPKQGLYIVSTLGLSEQVNHLDIEYLDNFIFEYSGIQLVEYFTSKSILNAFTCKIFFENYPSMCYNGFCGGKIKSKSDVMFCKRVEENSCYLTKGQGIELLSQIYKDHETENGYTILTGKKLKEYEKESELIKETENLISYWVSSKTETYHFGKIDGKRWLLEISAPDYCEAGRPPDDYREDK